MPSRGVSVLVPAVKTVLSPYETVTAPAACCARSPVSITSGMPAMSTWNFFVPSMSSLSLSLFVNRLATDAELGNQVLVGLLVLALQVIQEITTVLNLAQQSITGAVVLDASLPISIFALKVFPI